MGNIDHLATFNFGHTNESGVVRNSLPAPDMPLATMIASFNSDGHDFLDKLFVGDLVHATISRHQKTEAFKASFNPAHPARFSTYDINGNFSHTSMPSDVYQFFLVDLPLSVSLQAVTDFIKNNCYMADGTTRPDTVYLGAPRKRA